MAAEHLLPSRRLAVETGLIAAAVGAIGVVYGAMVTDAGLPVWFAPVMGVFVLAASSEMLFVAALATGGPLPAAISALVVNLRHLPYGMAVRDMLGSGWRKALRAHLCNDETVAFALGQRVRQHGLAAYTCCGAGILVAWPAGALLGAAAGRVVDVHALGLDAMFPAVVLALIVPALRDRRMRWVCLAAGAGVVTVAQFVPAGLAPVLAVLLVPFVRGRRTVRD